MVDFLTLSIPGWLEPLLDRIADDWSNVVTPVIDVIEDGTFKYLYGSAKATSVGGFDWNLQFNWHGIPERERLRRKTPVSPIRYGDRAFCVAVQKQRNNRPLNMRECGSLHTVVLNSLKRENKISMSSLDANNDNLGMTVNYDI